MAVDITVYRARIHLHYTRHFKVRGIDHFSSFELLLMLSMLLLRSGDVEMNPGPDPSLSDSRDTDNSYLSSSVDSTDYEAIINGKFSLVHYNIQSLSNKIDILESELSTLSIVSLTETRLDQRIPDNDIKMNSYKLPFRRDRPGENHGGICVYVKENLYAKRRNDLEPQDIECVWIEVSFNHRKLLIGTFYRPPNSPASALSSIETSIGLAHDTNIKAIFITGDFNLAILKQGPKRKIENLCQQFNLIKIRNEIL